MISFLLWTASVAFTAWIMFHIGWWRAAVRYTEKIERIERVRESGNNAARVHEALTAPLEGPRPPLSLFGEQG